jgi:hypothetical protein
MDDSIEGVFLEQSGKKTTVGQVSNRASIRDWRRELPVNSDDVLPVAGEHRTDVPSYETSATRYKYHVFPAPSQACYPPTVTDSPILRSSPANASTSSSVRRA